MVWEFISYNAFIDTLQREAFTPAVGEQSLRFLMQLDHARQLVEDIDQGLVLPAHVVQGLPKLGFVRIAAGRLNMPMVFDDDTRFTPTRFAFLFDIIADPQTDTNREGLITATRQIERMFKAGRVDYDTAYLDWYRTLVESHKDVRPWALLLAHFPIRLAQAAQMLDTYVQTQAISKPEERQVWQTDVDHYTAGVSLGEKLHDEIFRDRWLKSALSDDEYDQVKDFAVPVLRELYSDIWDAGYAGYYTRCENLPRQ